jgi:hypothetical protein
MISESSNILEGLMIVDLDKISENINTLKGIDITVSH